MPTGGDIPVRGPRWLSRRGGWGLCAVILLLPACRLTGPDRRYDLIEAELRAREREVAALRGELGQHAQLNQLFGPTATCPPGTTPGPPPPPGWVQSVGRTPTLPLKEVVLAAGTGETDGYLQVVIAPRDDDGTAVKVPLRGVVRAYEISPEGLKFPLGEWDISPDAMRKSWKSGLLSSGYFLPLQWDRPPTTERLRIVARLASADGREFEADKDIRVQPQSGPTFPHAREELPPRLDFEELPPPARLRYRPPSSSHSDESP